MEYDEALLSNLTVPELQQECKRRGLKKSGIKIKLIQRLSEHIEKYGPEKVVPPIVPVEAAVVEKIVNTIHNPHPYMAEYEEQLIESANMEAAADQYYTTNEGKKTRAGRKTSINKRESPDETPEETPEETPAASIEKSIGSPVMDPRDMAEELTEPIHKSPAYNESCNDRIVQLPHENNEEHEGKDGEEMEDTVENLNGLDDEVKSNCDNEESFRTEREDEDELMEKMKDDVVTEALHTENDDDGIAETDEILEYIEDADDQPQIPEIEYNNESEKDEEIEVVVDNETVDEEEDIPLESIGEEVAEDEKEVLMVENELDNEGEVEVEDEIMEVNNEDDVEGLDELGEVEEEGEITINIEQQNDFDENNGDDHLDVMVSTHDDKITEESESEEHSGTPKPLKKTVVPVSLKKRVSLVASTDSPEEKAARRKRRWGASTTLMQESSVPISSESIKKLIPDMKIDAAALESVPELDYQEEDPVDNSNEVKQTLEDVEVISGTPPPKMTKVGRTVKVDSAKKITLNKCVTDEIVTVESDSGETAKANLPKQPVRTYLVDDEIDVQEQREKSPSPARNVVSQYIYIENLVRPYTINQLKLVMRRTGNISEGGFWINNIKSRCYVKFSSEEEASATRDALHGLRWPAGSPKVLKVDYAINEQMFTETEGLLGEKPKIVIEIEDKENDPIIISNDRGYESRRERNNSENKSKNEKKKRVSKEPEKVPEKEKRDEEREESPAKLLDDLFRKTKATPCIYWLPLTEEQIAEKEKHAEQNRSLNEGNNERPADHRDRVHMEHPSNDRFLDRRSQQFRNSNRSWR